MGGFGRLSLAGIGGGGNRPYIQLRAEAEYPGQKGCNMRRGRKPGKWPGKETINLHIDQRIWAIYKLWAIQEMTTVTNIAEQALLEFVADNVSKTPEEILDAEFLLKDVLVRRNQEVYSARKAKILKDKYPGMLSIANREKRIAMRAERDARESNVADNVATGNVSSTEV